ncbi:MAG: hypothetical protein FWE82_05090 [Defluviitaleaceae bacterium]|nr:hypothetical protein [Defluviitaleaceae bacterium]
MLFYILNTIMNMAALLKNAAIPSTAAVAVAVPAESKTIIQNIDFSNTLNGDRAGQQKSAEVMEVAADDLTYLLNRALVYVR